MNLIDLFWDALWSMFLDDNEWWLRERYPDTGKGD